MNILVITENLKTWESLQRVTTKAGLRHSYKCVASGCGKVNAAVTTALEINDDVAKYDCVVVTGSVTPGPTTANKGFIVPNQVLTWDVDITVADEITAVYDVEGFDDIKVLTGDSVVTDEVYKRCIERYGKEVVFDTIASGVCQITDDYGIATVIVYSTSADSTDFADGVINYIETLG